MQDACVILILILIPFPFSWRRLGYEGVCPSALPAQCARGVLLVVMVRLDIPM